MNFRDYGNMSREDWLDYMNSLRRSEGNYYPDIDVSVPTSTPVENFLVEQQERTTTTLFCPVQIGSNHFSLTPRYLACPMCFAMPDNPHKPDCEYELVTREELERMVTIR